MRRGVSDSTVLLGFYHSKDSMEVNDSQSSGWPKGFLGVASITMLVNNAGIGGTAPLLRSDIHEMEHRSRST